MNWYVRRCTDSGMGWEEDEYFQAVDDETAERYFSSFKSNRAIDGSEFFGYIERVDYPTRKWIEENFEYNMREMNRHHKLAQFFNGMIALGHFVEENE